MEIEVGEYGRTNLGNIFIFAWIEYEKGKIDKRKVLIGNGKKFTNNFYYFKENEKIIKHSKKIIDLIEDEDIVILEYKSPRYRKRITRRFEVSKIGDDISLKNSHCDFLCKVGDKKITDTICKNIKIKSIVTHKQFSNIEYKVEE